jgi:hypothetical protein
MKYGYPLPQRIQKFSELIANKQANSISKFDVKTASGTELHDVFRVSIELPKYRLDNTRTLALQEEYIYRENKNDDYFLDVESDVIQEVQHNILKSLISSSDKDKDLIRYFSKNTQTDPFILTHDGFVISGNRRLCAMRELVEKELDNHRNFLDIRVVILPNFEPEKIEQIEDYLEQQKDIKDPFSWISRGIGYRRRMKKHSISDEQLANITGIKKNEISALVNKVEISDRYLESIGKPKDYNLILEDEFAFETIFTCQIKDRNAAPSKKAAFEKLAFIAIKNKSEFADRMYKNITTIFQAQPLIHNGILNEFEDEIKDLNNEVANEIGLSGLQLFPDPTISIIKLIENPKNEEKVVEIISEKIEEYLALEKDKKKKSIVLDRVKKANTLLIEANTVKNHEVNKAGVLAQLTNIEKELEKLKNWVRS